VLAECFEFVLANDSEIFSAIPATPAVFVLRGDDPQSEPYVSKTANLRRRLQRLLGSPTEPSRKLNLRERVRSIEYSPTGSDFESGFLLYRVLRSLFPKKYADRLRLRFAPLVKLHLENEYPRASVTTRLGSSKGSNLYYGPFPSRAAAEKFASDSLDFFKMRRCVDDLHPDPAFPGCIYSEMKMCLAPCFKGCSDDEYRAEVGRVQAYFDSSGQSLVREISAQRDQASSNLDFENAAALHARIDKLNPVLDQLPEIVHRIDRLAAIIVQPSILPECVALFRIDSGLVSEPVAFSIQPAEHTKSQSMESRLQDVLASVPGNSAPTTLEAMEHLAILKRWYYRSGRAGEIFFADENVAMPWRRIVRGIARVYRGEPGQVGKPGRFGRTPSTTQASHPVRSE
jgi:excinuclease ABC subunit C